MRAGLWLLALFALAVAVALLARFDQGYVLVVYPPWRVEMSFILALLVVTALFGLTYFAIRMLRLALRLPADVRAWNRRRQSDRGEDDFSRAVAALIADRPEDAYRLARKAMVKQSMPLTALVAARAAAQRGDHEAARTSLDEATAGTAEFIAARQVIEGLLAESTTPPRLP